MVEKLKLFKMRFYCAIALQTNKAMTEIASYAQTPDSANCFIGLQGYKKSGPYFLWCRLYALQVLQLP